MPSSRPQVNLRLDADVLADVDAAAKTRNISRNEWIEREVLRGLGRTREAPAPAAAGELTRPEAFLRMSAHRMTFGTGKPPEKGGKG